MLCGSQKCYSCQKFGSPNKRDFQLRLPQNPQHFFYPFLLLHCWQLIYAVDITQPISAFLERHKWKPLDATANQQTRHFHLPSIQPFFRPPLRPPIPSRGPTTASTAVIRSPLPRPTSTSPASPSTSSSRGDTRTPTHPSSGKDARTVGASDGRS